MSKRITIQEGGISVVLTVDKIQTDNATNGTSIWVPEDETRLTSKYITANGKYKAEDDGYYGYNEITVAGVGNASGFDGDGDEARAYTDDDNLIIEKLPSYIEIVSPPSVDSGKYNDGQAIEKTGMVVRAYLSSGTVYGNVPLEEVEITPAIAHYDPNDYVPEQIVGPDTDEFVVTGGTPLRSLLASCAYGVTLQNINLWPDLECYNAMAVETGDEELSGHIGICRSEIETVVTDYYSATKGYFYGFSDSIIGQRIKLPCSLPVDVVGSVTFRTDTYYDKYKKKYVYILNRTINYSRYGGTAIYVTYTGINPTEDGYTVCGLNCVSIGGGARQNITVKWARPGDGKILQATFPITVRQNIQVS